MTDVSFADIPLDGRTISLEYAWIAPMSVAGPPQDANHPPGGSAAAQPQAWGDHTKRTAAPLVVFLHEGLGSLAMWKDYPRRLCDAAELRGLVYSRAGYGRSTPRRGDERWPVDFMHRQARDVLPRLFDRLGIGADGAKPWLFGHSDGASIALIHAASFPEAVAGVVAVAPHIVVEDVSIASIEAAREAYRLTGIKARLARYHDDPDSAFWGWNDIWLDPRFREWSIEAILPRLRCPILAVQGEDDEYGTLGQVEGLRTRAPQTEVVVLSQCGHSPHRDQPDALTRVVVDFIRRHSPALTFEGGLS